MKRRVALPLGIAISGFCGSAAAATLYVAPNGSDGAANPGTSIATPLRTIARAVALVAPGDAIEVRAGTYTERVIVQRPGTAAAWIVLRAYAGESPVLRSTGAGPTVYFYHSDCDEDTIGNGSGNVDCRPMYWRVEGLTIQGSASGGGDGYVVKIDTPKVHLVNNRLCCSTVDIVKLVRTANDVEIVGNEIWQDAAVVVPGANAQGVDIVGADRTHVAGNYVHDVPDFGIYAKGNARNPVFERNRLVNIGRADNGNALMLGQSTDAERLVDGPFETYDGIVRNNVVVGATWACLATSSSSNARFYNNSCYDTGRSAQASILLTNESEIGQAGANIRFVHNIVQGSAARPIVKIGSSAMSDYAGLAFSRNLYFAGGTAPQFAASDFFSPVGFAQWQTNFAALSGHADDSTVADPRYQATTGTTPLIPGATSAAVDGGDNAQMETRSDYRGAARPQGAAIDIGAYEAGVVDRVFCDAFALPAGC